MNSFLESLAIQTEQWIRAQRIAHMDQAGPLTPAENASLADDVDAALRDRVRVMAVCEISNPPFLNEAISALRDAGIDTQFDFRGAAGITFDDCVLVRGNARGSTLLLHELVHVEQYRRLGIAGFARGYIFGLEQAGFVYEDNPFEVAAFQLESRFGAGEAFDLTREVGVWLEKQPVWGKSVI